MAFYKDCFGGELDLMTVAGSPIEKDMPAEAKNDILHSTLITDAFTLMASDMRLEGFVPQDGSVSLMVDCASGEDAERIFSHLSNEGKVGCPLGPSFWGATFGALTDKFGIGWLIHHAAPQA